MAKKGSHNNSGQPPETPTERPTKWVASRPLPEDLYLVDAYYNCTSPEDWDEMVYKWDQADRRKKGKKSKKDIEFGKGDFSNVVQFPSGRPPKGSGSPSRF